MGMRLLPMTVLELTAHALELERETVQRYGMYAQSMRQKGIWTMAAFFEQLYRASRERVEEMQDMVGPRERPAYSPWEYAWRLTYCPDAIEYRPRLVPSSAREALQLALAARRRADGYLEDVRANAHDGAVRRHAAALLAGGSYALNRLEARLAGEIYEERQLEKRKERHQPA